MPAPRLPWFRIWMDATTHEKVRQLDDGQFRTWVELLDAASKQTIRGRFASRASAVSLVRRPAAHVAALINARLIDEDDDKRLTMHDWDEWQRWRKEDVNNTPTPPEHLPNDSRTSSEPPTNGRANDSPTPTELLANDQSSRVRAAAPVRREERREIRDIDVEEEDVLPPAAPQRPPQGARRRVTIVDDEFKTNLETQYAELFGSTVAVRDVIDTAMGHTARLKCSDQQAYLRGWVRRDAQRLPGARNGAVSAIEHEPPSKRPLEQHEGPMPTVTPCAKCRRPIAGLRPGSKCNQCSQEAA